MEQIELINERLLNFYGKSDDGRAIWRVVFSEDQYEKRLSWHTPEGFQLLSPRMVELPKYKQWIHNCYVLERLMPVPEVNQRELVDKTSYEPVWTFSDKHGNPLPPKWEVIEIVIRTIHQQSAMAVGAKYKDIEDDEPIEAKRERITKLEQELFGNETEVGDALAHKQGIVVPRNYGN